MADKVIVTNWTALKKKYGAKTAKLEAAIKKMIAADKARGVSTVLLRVDVPADMKKVGGAAVTSARSEKQNKQAIDKIDAKLSPDYILILGSVDVIPHQSLNNPVFEPGGDDDKFAFSDLPYACDARYGKDPADFIGATRVVGRLPNITGDTNPAYMISLIEKAAAWEASPPSVYANGFGITALVLEGIDRDEHEESVRLGCGGQAVSGGRSEMDIGAAVAPQPFHQLSRLIGRSVFLRAKGKQFPRGARCVVCRGQGFARHGGGDRVLLRRGIV